MGGGVATEALKAGLVDEMVLHQVPILLGGGERLFDKLDAGAAEVELTDLVEGPEALHLSYRLRY